MTFISDIVSKYVHESHVSAIKEMAMRSAQVPDSVSLSWGLPSFRTPEYIRNGVKSLLDTDEDAGKYTFPDGLSGLRELVVKSHYQKTGLTVDANRHVMINAGNMQGLNTLFHTMLDPGDEIILTDPCFASHIQQVTLFNGVPVYWQLDEENGWQLDIAKLSRLITGKTQAIVLVSPSNPTGTIFKKEDLLQVARIAKQNNIFVIVDDPYSDFLYENKQDYFNLAAVEEFRDHLIYLYSFSKAYAMSGWRLSYTVMPEEFKQEAMKVHDSTIICAPRISQLAGMVALSQESDHKKDFQETLLARRILIEQRLDKLAHVFSYQPPQGAYYVFPKINLDHLSSRDFCIELLNNAGVALTPGSAFGPSGEGHVRMAYCVDEEEINTAFDRMEQYYGK